MRAGASLALAAGLASLTVAAAAAQSTPSPPPEGGARVELVVRGLRNARGRVLAGLYGHASGWPEPGRHLVRCDVLISGASARCSFEHVTPGRYAIAVTHDEDGDGELDRGLFGIPTEGYAFSNDAAPNMGPPSFERAAFVVGSRDVVQRVLARY